MGRYGGDASQVVDVTRARIVCPDAAAVLRCLRAVLLDAAAAARGGGFGDAFLDVGGGSGGG